MVNRKVNLRNVLAAMEADTTITPEQKKVINSKVLDGRFFSYPLDKHFGNPDHIMP